MNYLWLVPTKGLEWYKSPELGFMSWNVRWRLLELTVWLGRPDQFGPANSCCQDKDLSKLRAG